VIDGVVIRPLETSDHRALRYAFEHLGERSRYQRYLAVMPRLSERQLGYLMTVDHWHHEALIAWASSPRRPVGVARYVRAGEFDVAEVAVEVIDGWQRLGIGTALVAELVRVARAAGVRRFAATMLAGNTAALQLAESVGPARPRRIDADTVELAIDLVEAVSATRARTSAAR